jgi:hypothetical protein
MEEAVRRTLSWRRSSDCADAACVEVAIDGEFVFLRDGKSPGGAILCFTRTEWNAFLVGVRVGEFE